MCSKTEIKLIFYLKSILKLNNLSAQQIIPDFYIEEKKIMLKKEVTLVTNNYKRIILLHFLNKN